VGVCVRACLFVFERACVCVACVHQCEGAWRGSVCAVKGQRAISKAVRQSSAHTMQSLIKLQLHTLWNGECWCVHPCVCLVLSLCLVVLLMGFCGSGMKTCTFKSRWVSFRMAHSSKTRRQA